MGRGGGVGLAEVRPIDFFDYLTGRTQRNKRTAGSTVVRCLSGGRRVLRRRPSHRPVAGTVRSSPVITGVVMARPVPAPRRPCGFGLVGAGGGAVS